MELLSAHRPPLTDSGLAINRLIMAFTSCLRSIQLMDTLGVGFAESTTRNFFSSLTSGVSGRAADLADKLLC